MVLRMMAAAEDDDYMSDKYLSNNADVRPGLVFKRGTKRQYELEERHKMKNETTRTKSKKVLEEEKRDEGLQKTLGVENKGFSMLQKMGYKPGTSLGKSGTGRIEPVPVNIKCGRSGLGRDEFLKQKRNEITQMKLRLKSKRKQNLTMKSEEFLKFQRSKAAEKQTARDLWNSQKSCQQLDHAMGLTEPPEIWFWPEQVKNADEHSSDESESEDNELDLQPADKLEILTEYLRNTHIFCVWCGTVYDDEEDLKSNCPGITFDDH